MAGHSAWSNIASHKGVADKKRAALFTRLARAITVAARDGGDPNMNARLRCAVDSARAASMPKENIERAIKKGTGELNDGVVMQEGLYEISICNVYLLVETISDNPNRTSNELKTMVSKEAGTVLAPGSAKYAFYHLAIIRIRREELANRDKEALTLEWIDAGAQDVQELPEGYTILGPVETFKQLVDCCKRQNISVLTAGLEYLAKNYQIYTPKHYTDEEDRLTFNALLKAIEERDDVQNVWKDGEWHEWH